MSSARPSTAARRFRASARNRSSSVEFGLSCPYVARNLSHAFVSISGVAGASAGTDTLVLTATDIPGPGLFFQSNGLTPSPVPFGDGQLCAGVGILRLGVVFPTAGVASYPGGLTPNPIHVQGLANNGDTKHYQCWYRSVPGLCSANNFDLTQGVTLVWGP